MFYKLWLVAFNHHEAWLTNESVQPHPFNELGKGWNYLTRLYLKQKVSQRGSLDEKNYCEVMRLLHGLELVVVAQFGAILKEDLIVAFFVLAHFDHTRSVSSLR